MDFLGQRLISKRHTWFPLSHLAQFSLILIVPMVLTVNLGKFMLPVLPKRAEARLYLPLRVLIVDSNKCGVDIHVVHRRTPCWCPNPAQIFGQSSTKKSERIPQCL